MQTTAQETGVEETDAEESVAREEQEEIVLDEKPFESEIKERAPQFVQEEAVTETPEGDTEDVEGASPADTSVNAYYTGTQVQGMPPETVQIMGKDKNGEEL